MLFHRRLEIHTRSMQNAISLQINPLKFHFLLRIDCAILPVRFKAFKLPTFLKSYYCSRAAEKDTVLLISHSHPL